MSHHNPIINYLHQQKVPFERLPHTSTESLLQAAVTLGVDPAQVARAVLMGDDKGLVLVILPLNHIINFSRLLSLAQRKLKPVDRSAARNILHDCEAGTLPPITAPFKLATYVDEALFNNRFIYLEPGSHTELIRLKSSDFRRLHSKSSLGRFSISTELLHASEQEMTRGRDDAHSQKVRQLRPQQQLKERILELRKLPPLLNLSSQLLQLRAEPDATPQQLAAIIESDPSLSAQILQHARSPYYGYQGEVESVEQAISQVLGFDSVINTALGLTALRPFDIPADGPLGVNSLWRHAIHTANLTHSLSLLLPQQLEASPGTAYLAGLLHNLGLLVLGHLLKPEYFLLNRTVEANPEVPLTLIEKRTLGFSHSQIGAWLMRAWKMPEVLETTLREHHNEFYRGDNWVYPNLVMLANCLLKPYGLGDAAEAMPPPVLLNALGISLEDAVRTTKKQMESATDLDVLASQVMPDKIAVALKSAFASSM